MTLLVQFSAEALFKGGYSGISGFSPPPGEVPEGWGRPGAALSADPAERRGSADSRDGPDFHLLPARPGGQIVLAGDVRWTNVRISARAL
jgi:hypothetical protein